VQNEIALAQFARARGELAEAERRLRDALPTALEQGGWVLTDLYRLLVQVLAEAGSVDEAAELAEFAARDGVEDRSYTFAAVLLARASVAAARGDEFVQQYEQALGLLDELGLPIDASLARIAYADALTRAGDEERARRQLELAQAAVGPGVSAPPPSGA
jgi:tetratricopeptide (TPR) repeat protein